MHKTTIQAILFDLDGTLMDTAPDLVNSLNIQLQKHHLPTVSYNEARSWVSQGAIKLIEFGFGKLASQDNITELREEFLHIYEKNNYVQSALFPNMDTLLNYIEKHNMPWGIVTNKPDYLAIDILQKAHLYKRIATFYGANTLPKRKPAPDQLIAASNDMNIPCKNILYLGDDERDIIAAKAAGMPNAVVNYGYINTRIPPLNWQADYYFDNALEIINYLQNP